MVGSSNARVGIPAGIEILRGGGSALDAAVAAVKLIEDNLDDHSVGTGGIPNILGEVELDAALMDGRSLSSGAVAAIKRHPNPIEIARKVMEITPHALLVGEGADLFAELHGFEPRELLTDDARRIWRERVEGAAEAKQDVQGDAYQLALEGWTELLHDRIFGTTNVIARDSNGNIACATSTSGWGFKWPGRVGDTPIVGAGNYADSRYGAAACTGRGEMAMRAATAHSVVMFMRHGNPLEEALKQGMLDLRDLEDKYVTRAGIMNIVGMDANGNVSATSTSNESTFVFQRTDMDAFEEQPRIHVPLQAD